MYTRYRKVSPVGRFPIRAHDGAVRRLFLALVMAIAILGCGSSAPSRGPATPEPVATGSAPPGSGSVATPVDASANPEPTAGPSDDEIAQAMRERADFGLRADEAWVRQVAANPRSRTAD